MWLQPSALDLFVWATAFAGGGAMGRDGDMSELRQKRPFVDATAAHRGGVGAALVVMTVAFTSGGMHTASADPADCTEVAGVATCTGNQSEGVASGDDFASSDTVLNVNTLTSDIMPALDTNGILFSGDTTVEINSNLGYGKFAHSIYINGYGDGVLGVAPGNVVINHVGDIYDAFRGINGHSTGGDVTINAHANIDNAAAAAINGYADSGSVTIRETGAITNAQDRGISAIAGDGNVSIRQWGDITSVNQAIFAQATGGSIDIRGTGQIYTSSGDAIDAEAGSAGATVSVRHLGAIDAHDRAIFINSNGDGSVTSYGDVTSRNLDAIHIESPGMASIFSRGDILAANQGLFAHGSTGAAIDSRGDVTTGYGANPGNDAVFALTNTGDATIASHGDITAPNGRGVVAMTNGGAASIVSYGMVTTKIDSVYAQGTTGASITQYGDVSSQMANGLSAYTSNGNASVSGWGDVTAHVNGIVAQTGTGDASVDHTGDVTGSYGEGVRAQASTGDATVNQTGDVWAYTIGVSAVSNSGNASVTANGDVYSAFTSGIEADASGGGNATINSTGDVNAYTHGLLAVNTGTGNASITHVGDVTSRMGTGAEAFASTGNATISITGDTDAHLFGIKAITSGAGSTATVTNKGDVTAATASGIYAEALGAGGTASVNSKGDIFADRYFNVDHYEGGYGIQVLADGDASGTSTGNITSLENNAFDVESTNGSASISSEGTISAGNQGLFALGKTAASINSTGNVTAENDAVFAYTKGTGNTTVTSKGDVTSTLARGVIAMTDVGNATVTSTGNVDASVQGVAAYVNSGNGDASVTQTGDVISHTSTGIKARTSGNGDATVVSNGNVTAQVEAITADVGGSGDASVTHTGNATSSAASGIVANVDGNGDATINVNGNVQAQQQGVSALTHTGDASVTQSGDVTSTMAFGVRADVLGSGDATIEGGGGTVTAHLDGVTADVEGDGNALAHFDGDVTSSISTGIAAIAKGTGNATVEGSGNVTSALESLLAVANIGTATINYDGDGLHSTGAFGANAVTTDGSVVVDISGDITSQLYGIHGIAGGTGRSVGITYSNGTINALTSRGISGEALGAGSTVTINSSGDINSSDMSLFAHANGYAGITSVGDLVSTSGHAAYALSEAGSAYVSSTGDVTASDTALFAMGPTGATVHSSGDVSSATGRAIDAETTGGAAEVVSNGNLTAGDAAGIFAMGQTGASVQSTGDVTISGSGRGIDAETAAGVASITSVGDVSSQDLALFAHGQTGATINSTGDVTASGSDAIFALNEGAGVARVTSVGDVSAGSRGIVAINNSPGDSIIESTGDVTAPNVALQAFTDDGNASVTSTGDVTSTNEMGIQAQSLNNGTATIVSSGKVTSSLQGLFASALTGAASATQTGDVTSNHTAIEVLSYENSATIVSSGDVQARLEGLKAIANLNNTGSGSASITQHGDVTSTNSFGINSEAWGAGGNSTVDVTGDVSAYETAVQSLAFGASSAAAITSHGSISSQWSNGLQAQATGSGSTASINANGTVQAEFLGVFALANFDVTIDYVGNSTSQVSDAVMGQSYNGSVTIHATGNQTGDVLGTGARHGIFALGYGNVDVTSVGDVTTSSNERALQAQSNNGDVMVDVTGHVHVDGINGDSDAIFAFAPNGHADVTVRAGSEITGGTDPLASFGVEFGSATGTNTLINYGTIDDANGGKTIGGDTAAEVVTNYGLVDGDFYLADGANRFDNMLGGWTYFKAYSQVGAGNDFNNTGSVSPYGPMVIGSSVLDGNFNQSGTGSFWTDVDYDTATADYLDVTGDIGAGGDVHAYITNLGTTLGPVAATIMHSTGAVTDNGIVGDDQGPLMVDVTTTAQTVDINVAIDFGVGGGLTPNAQAVGDYFQGLFESTVPGGLTPDQEAYYLALVNYGDTAAYDSLLNGLYDVPATFAASVPLVADGADAFADNLFSCRQRDGTYRFIAEGKCVWAAAGVRSFNQGAGATPAFNDTAGSLAGGAQFAAGPNWVIGLGAGYEHGHSTSGPDVDLQRNMFNAGIVAKGTYGNAQIAAALTGGTGSINSTRMVTLPVVATATGNRNVSYIDLTGRASYVKQMGSMYLKPSLEGAATFVSAGVLNETGAGIADYMIGATSSVVGRGTVSLELGGEFGSADGVLYRPFVSAGATVLTGQNVSVQAGFPGLGPGSFTATSDMDSVFADVRAGLYVLGQTGWTTRLEYDGRFSANSQQHSGTVKVSVPF